MEKQKIVIVDVSDAAKDKAQEVAESRLTESLETQRGVRGFIQRIWKHNLFFEYYRQKEIQKAKKEIEETDNIYAGEGREKSAHDAAMKTIVEQFSSQYEETIHTEAGEERKRLGNTKEEMEIKSRIKELILDFASKDLEKKDTIQSFLEERNRIFSAVRGVKNEIIDTGVLYADNLLDITRAIKNSIVLKSQFEKDDYELDVMLGKAKSGVRTEAQFNAVDRIIDKIQRTKVGRFANEATIASAVSIAYSLSAGLSQRLASSQIFAWSSFGATAVFGAGIAGLREKKRLEEERRQHGREMAMNKKFSPEKSPRRKEMEKFRHETREAGALAKALEESLYKEEKGGAWELRDLTPEEFQIVLGNLTEIEARIKLSDTKKVDLISFSDSTKVEKERLRLDILRAQAKVDLQKLIDSETKNKGTALAKALEILKGKKLEDHLSLLCGARLEQLTTGNEGMEKRNALFRAMRNKQVAKAAVKGLITGLIVGGAAQEISAFFREGQEGFVEGLTKGHETATKEVPSFTFSEYLRRYFTEDLPRADMSNIHEIMIGDNQIKLPEGVDLLKNTDGSFNLMRGEDIISENITFDSQGHLTEEARKILGESDVIATSTTEQIVGEETTQVSARDYIERHRDDLTEVRRKLWYDNDTSSIYDKNELRLDWGGKNGTGIDENGNFVYSVRRMMPDGSYHKEFSADALELAKEGRLKLLLTLSRDTQSYVFEVPIDENYNAIIEPDSKVGRLLFENVDGRARLLAQFAEVAEIIDAKDNVNYVRLLATDIGQGVNSITDMVPTTKDIPVTIFETPADYRVDPPLFIPIFGRRPLESLTKESTPPKTKQQNEEENSFLEKNSDTSFNHIKNYLEKLKNLKEIESAAEVIEKMDPGCRVVVPILVAAHQESKNIYRTIENYLPQTADREKLELLLFVYYPKKDKDEKSINLDETSSEIERFKKNYPDVKIRIIKKELSSEEVQIGSIKNFLNDLTLFRHHQRGKETSDLIIVNNNNNNKRFNPEYINNFITKFDADPNINAILGRVDWDPKSYIKNPLIHIGTQLFQYITSQYRSEKKHIASSGANIAIRSSVYAQVGSHEENLGTDKDDNIIEKIIFAHPDAKQDIITFADDIPYSYISLEEAKEDLKKELNFIKEWATVFGKFEDEARKTKWEEINRGIDFDDEKEVKEFIDNLESVINQIITHQGGKSMTPFLRRALGWLDIKYNIVGDYAIKITDASALLEGLKHYQKEGLEMLNRKTGQPKGTK